MKLKIFGLAAGAALLALGSAPASAHTDVHVGIGFAIPAPIVVERYPAYRYEVEHAPVYYYDQRAYYDERPRYEVREYRHAKHKQRWHRHQHRHHR